MTWWSSALQAPSQGCTIEGESLTVEDADAAYVRWAYSGVAMAHARAMGVHAYTAADALSRHSDFAAELLTGKETAR